MQKNWIGARKVRLVLEYEIENQKRVLWVFTRAPTP